MQRSREGGEGEGMQRSREGGGGGTEKEGDAEK